MDSQFMCQRYGISDNLNLILIGRTYADRTVSQKDKPVFLGKFTDGYLADKRFWGYEAVFFVKQGTQKG